MENRRGRFRQLGWSAAFLLGGCGAPTAPSPATEMLGAWSYASAPRGDHPPSLNTGLHVTLAVESVEGMQFIGRVTRWFAGDVGIALNAFGPVTGTVDGKGGVTVSVAWAAPGVPTLTITGVLDGDVLTVRESWYGAGPGPFHAGECFRRSF